MEDLCSNLCGFIVQFLKCFWDVFVVWVFSFGVGGCFYSKHLAQIKFLEFLGSP